MATTIAEFAAKLGLIADEGQWEHGEKLIEGIKSKIEIFLGLEAIHKIGEMVEGTVNAAVAVKHLAAETGTSAEAIQELGYAASLSGSSAEEMQVSFQHLARGMEEARTKGSGPFLDALRQLHVSFASLKGKSPDEVIEILADRLAALPDGFKKSALAGELFGERSGARLIPLLNRGAAGIRELRAEAELTGGVLGGEAIEKAEEFEGANKKLHATLTGLKNQAVTALLPALTKLLEKFTEWVNENKELVTSILEGVVKALEYVGRGVATFLEGVSAVVEFLKEHSDLATALIIGLGATIAAFAIASAINWILAFWPVALAIVAIAALALYVKKFSELLIGHQLTWRQLWDDIVRGGQRVVAFFTDTFTSITGFFTDIATTIANVWEETWDAVVEGAKNAWNKIRGLPIIGHLIKAGEFVATAGGATTQSINPQELGRQLLEQQQSAQQQNVTFGDNHITVTASTNAPAGEIAAAVADQVDAKNQEMLRKAAAAFGAGA